MFKNFIQKITYSGVDLATDSHDRKCILIINRMSIILALLMLMFVALVPILKTYHMLYFSVTFLFAFSAAPFFNARGWLTFTKWFFTFTPVICLLIVCFNNSINLGDRFFFFTTATIPIILFRKTWVIYSVFYVSVAAFVFASWYQSTHEPVMRLPKEIETQYYYFTLISVFAVLFFVIRYFKRDSDEYENELEEKNDLITVKNKEIYDSINYAKRIQYTLLANESLLKRNLPSHFILFNPKDIVSGDFYWATEKDDKFYLAVCDSTGHGVPGAFMSLLNISFLNEAINEKNISAPNEIFNYVRKRLIENISQDGAQDGMDAVLLCFDKTKNKITYASANNSVVQITNNTSLILQADKMPIGKGEKKEDFRLFDLNVSKGDTIYLYTDGYADQFGGLRGKKYKYKQLNELLLSISPKSLPEQKEILNSTFTNWKGNLEQVDDVCIIGIKL